MFDKVSKFIRISKGDYFMKKSLQLTLILSTLLFTFSCDGVVEPEGPQSEELSETWHVANISAYDDEGCSETSIFSEANVDESFNVV